MDEQGGEDRNLQAAIQQEVTTTDYPAELEKIFQQHRAMVFRSAYRLTGNAEDAEDVLQAVFLRLLRRQEPPGPVEKLEGYLRRAAVNAALDVLRARTSARKTPLEETPPLVAERRDNPELSCQTGELRQALRAAMARLGPRAAEVFALRYIEGYGNKEIARLLGASPFTIAVILHRARGRLRSHIRELAGGYHGKQAFPS